MCNVRAKVKRMEPGADSSKWQTATANEHTCQAALEGDGNVEPVAKRARTIAPRESAVREHLAGGDDLNAALFQLRARHRNLIRGAMKSRSILLVSAPNRWQAGRTSRTRSGLEGKRDYVLALCGQSQRHYFI